MKRILNLLPCVVLFATGCSSYSANGPKPIDVSTVNFKSVVSDNEQPVLVDCWAPWCGPCRVLAPTIDELAADYEGRVTVVKLNTDENPELSRQFQIAAIPTVLLFKNGQVVSRREGVQPKGNFVQDIEAALAK